MSATPIVASLAMVATDQSSDARLVVVIGPATLTETQQRVVGAPVASAKRRRASSARCQKHASRDFRPGSPSRPGSRASDLGRDLGRCAVATGRRDEWARFLNRDPAVAMTHEPYAYAGNNPANYTDPTGLCREGEMYGNSGECIPIPSSSAKPSINNGVPQYQSNDEVMDERMEEYGKTRPANHCTSRSCYYASIAAEPGSLAPPFHGISTAEERNAWGRWAFWNGSTAGIKGTGPWAVLSTALDLFIRGLTSASTEMTPGFAGSTSTSQYCDIAGIPNRP